MHSLKEKLHQQCIEYVKSRMDAAERAFRDAEKAQNEDTKSSAGDKYETGRAMMQQEKDRNTIQLNEANKLMVALNTISIKGISLIADTGSVVVTDNGQFYLAVSAGIIVVDGVNYFAVSPASPIGVKLKGVKAGDGFEVNGKKYKVLEVV